MAHYTQPVAATDVGTGVTNFANTDTVTLDGRVYTFQSTLTNVDGHVKIGATLALTLANFKNAVNLDAGVVGTDYATAMTVHATIKCTASTATTITFAARIAGIIGNSLITAKSITGTDFAFATTNLAGGTGSVGTTLAAVLVALAITQRNGAVEEAYVALGVLSALANG